MQSRVVFPLLVVLAVLFLIPASAAGQCTINFDSSCPDFAPECDASFSGGSGCIRAGLGNCYDTGSRAYQVGASTPATVLLTTPIQSIDVFFAHSGGGTSGTMRFYSADSTEIGTPITTNGDCGSGPMPPTQVRNFSTPVWRVEATVSGGGSGWIDTMALTAASVPAVPITWGRLKAVYP